MGSETEEPFFAVDPTELGISFGEPRRQQRGSIALRGLLLLPLLAVVGALEIVGHVLAIIGWFGALVLGRLPRWIAVFELKVIAYSVGVNAYVFLLVDKYPPFALLPADYPIAIQVGASHLSRWKVFFRWLLAIPAAFAANVARGGLFVLSPIIWLVTLVRGRPPQLFFSAAAAVIRYHARYYAYISLVTDIYPRRLFGDGETDWVGGFVSEPDAERSRDLRVPLSAGARRLMVLILVLGIATAIGSGVLRVELNSTTTTPLVAAEQDFESSSLTSMHSLAACQGIKYPLACKKRSELSLSKNFDRFASSLSRLSFSGADANLAVALEGQARTAALALRSASQATTTSAHDRAFLEFEVQLNQFEADARALLGHSL